MNQAVVWNLNGDSLRVDVQANEKGLKLKQEIEDKLGVPTIFQRLVTPTAEELNDSEAIVHQDYQMVLSMDRVQQQIEHGQSSRRIKALIDLGKLGLRGGEPAVATVCKCLEDAHLGRDLRETALALSALAQVACKGDQHVLSELTTHLDHPAGDMRQAAVNGLAQVAQKGDKDVIAAVSACLEDRKQHVRRAALRALAEVAERGDEHVIAAVSDCLEDPASDVRYWAVMALARVAERGDEHAIAAVLRRLEDTDRHVKIAALKALAEVADKGNQQVRDVVSRHLGDADYPVRGQAMSTLNLLAERELHAQSEAVDSSRR